MRHALKPIFSAATLAFALALFSLVGCSGFAQTPPTNRPWAYLLLHDSYLLDDCPICDRVSIPVPMRGTFNLRLVDENPIFSRYALEDIQLTAGDRPYRVTGSGTFEIGGEVAVTLQMALQVRIDDGFTNKECYFTNTTKTVDRPWPMLDVTLGQTNGTFAQVFTLRLAAAPVREIWFSTDTFFASDTGQGGVRFILGGDLISTSGRIVKCNGELYSSVGIRVPGPDLGLNAVDILPGGEIAFSLGVNAPSETLGLIQHGDLLSNQGLILRRNQDLLAPFVIQPPVPDTGLDAVQILDTGEILFSIQTNVFSEKLGVTLHRGDLLSSTGGVARSYQQLLARFQPTNASTDYGLDALYRWANGEIWFSTEDNFQDQQLGSISSGDLLSDRGYIVFRQGELLSVFAPVINPPSFGLDALYVVTDATPAAPSPRLSIQAKPSTRSTALTWQGQGRVFQVERAEVVTGPFQPLSPLQPDLSFDDLGTLTNRAQSYYRLRQW